MPMGAPQQYPNQPTPLGTSFGPTGNVQPDPGVTVNSQGQPMGIPGNIAIGGGTQTNFPSIAGGLASLSSQKSSQYVAAEQAYNQAADEMKQLQEDFAQQSGNIQGDRTNLFEQGGEQGIAQNILSGKQAAIAGRMQAAADIMQRETAQQQTEQSGLAAAGGLAQPQQAGPMNVQFNPLTGQYGPASINSYGSGGFTQYGIMQGQQTAGQQYVQNQAILGKVQPMAQNLDSLIKEANINPSDATFVNQWQNWARTNLFSDSRIPEFQGQLNDIIQSISGILGVPQANSSDFRTQFAGAIVNGLQRGQSISDSINYFVQQAEQASQGYLRGAQGASQGQTTGQSVQAGGYNYSLQNGKWVVSQ